MIRVILNIFHACTRKQMHSLTISPNEPNNAAIVGLQQYAGQGKIYLYNI